MAKRYELSDEQWKKIEDLLPGKERDRGRTAKDKRNFINGVLWVRRSGARWPNLPERYGQYKSVHKRLSRWAKNSLWEELFHVLIKDKNNDDLMLDSTIVKAHQPAATYKKRPSFGAFPRKAEYENSSIV